MRRLSMLAMVIFFATIANSGGVGTSYASDYNYDAKLATNKIVPIEIEKTKIDEPTLSLVMSASVLKAYGKCDNQIKFLPGESKVDHDARVAREAAEAQALADAQAQAEAEAQAQAQAKVRKVRVLPLAGPDMGDAWYRLRQCESGNTYSSNSGNGYYGAYQFNISTWRSNAPAGWEDVRPDLAPEAIQDQAALNLYNARGGSPWPVCSIRAGLT